MTNGDLVESSIALHARLKPSGERLPTKLDTLVEVQASLAPIESGLSNEQKLRAALNLTAALLNAQLAQDMIESSDRSSPCPVLSLPLVAVLAVTVGVLLTILVFRGRKPALPVSGDVKLVIDMQRAAHDVTPPASQVYTGTTAASAIAAAANALAIVPACSEQRDPKDESHVVATATPLYALP